jgi:hypothetical protein
MNRRKLWCERTTTEKLGRAWQSVRIRRIGRRPRVHRNIGFRIASGWIAGYNRHANRSPSQAVTSGDSQNQPNSPPTLCAVTSRCSTTPASRRAHFSFSYSIDPEPLGDRSLSVGSQRAYKSQVPFLRWALTLVCGICSSASGSICTARSARLKIRQPWKRTCCGETQSRLLASGGEKCQLSPKLTIPKNGEHVKSRQHEGIFEVEQLVSGL